MPLNTEEQVLWNKISSFPLDKRGIPITFSFKLAKENDWTSAYTQRAIIEYRRFLFLCCINPSGISPSYVVDQVWHLHLTYTKSYWVDLCRNTLDREIHHEPGDGTIQDTQKLDLIYKATLKLYQDKFDVEAPGEIWHKPKMEDAGKLKNAVSKNSVLVTAFAVLLLPLFADHIEIDEASVLAVAVVVIVLLVIVVSIVKEWLAKRQRRTERRTNKDERTGGCSTLICSGIACSHHTNTTTDNSTHNSYADSNETTSEGGGGGNFSCSSDSSCSSASDSTSSCSSSSCSSCSSSCSSSD